MNAAAAFMTKTARPGRFSLTHSMNFFRKLPALLALGAAICTTALGQIAVSGQQVVATLVADTVAVAAGQPFTAGVRLVIAPTWYLYWQSAGDIGVPTSVEWELPAGFKAGPLQWPLPVTHEAAGDFLNYVYEREVLLMAEITPPAALPTGPVTIKAKVKWQVCDPRQCVPGEADLALELPAGAAAAADAELFAAWRAQLPREGGAPFPVRWDTSKADTFSLRIEGLGAGYRAEFFPLPPTGVKLEHPQASEVAADGTRTITFPIGEGGAAHLPWRGVLAVEKKGEPRQGWLLASEAVPSVASASPVKPDASLLWKLLAAFLGGLIMNVMPCVLPVIALKIFGFVNQAGQEPARVFRLGLAFNAGVFAFFLGLAAAVARLKLAFNWGYQFQNPYLLAGMIALVFVFALSLLGVFEVTLGGAEAKLSTLSSREGYGGAFVHGLFTTLLGTSCTAPFLATSLSFATTQSTPVIFLLFAAIAAGMSLPFFLLTARPAWLRYVPKPGPWMERVKQLMGFFMLAVAVWLFTVLALRGAAAVAGMSWFLLALGLACWAFGTWRESVAVRVLVVLLPVGAYFLFLEGKLNALRPVASAGQHWQTGSIEWTAYSEEQLADARQAGRAVFVDFTAEWCINCKAYERLVLATDAVGKKFAEKKVVALRADWTNTDDPVVTPALKKFGRIGVPLYVLYRPGETEPVVLDALTPSALIAELDRIAN